MKKSITPKFAVVAMNSKGKFEWVVDQAKNGRYKYSTRRNAEWSFSTKELTEVVYDDDDILGWEDLLNVTEDVKSKGRKVAFVSSSNVKLAELNERTIITQMREEVIRLAAFYRKLLKKNQVDAGLILRLVELERSLEVVSRTMNENDELGLSDVKTESYFGRLEFDAITVVETDTSNAVYAYTRLQDIFRELNAHSLTEHLVSYPCEKIALEAAKTAKGFSDKKYAKHFEKELADA